MPLWVCHSWSVRISQFMDCDGHVIIPNITPITNHQPSFISYITYIHLYSSIYPHVYGVTIFIYIYHILNTISAFVFCPCFNDVYVYIYALIQQRGSHEVQAVQSSSNRNGPFWFQDKLNTLISCQDINEYWQLLVKHSQTIINYIYNWLISCQKWWFKMI